MGSSKTSPNYLHALSHVKKENKSGRAAAGTTSRQHKGNLNSTTAGLASSRGHLKNEHIRADRGSLGWIITEKGISFLKVHGWIDIGKLIRIDKERGADKAIKYLKESFEALENKRESVHLFRIFEGRLLFPKTKRKGSKDIKISRGLAEAVVEITKEIDEIKEEREKFNQEIREL